jgi:hypothetical protein
MTKNCICNNCMYLLSCEFQPKNNECELYKSYNDSENLTDTIEGDYYGKDRKKRT